MASCLHTLDQLLQSNKPNCLRRADDREEEYTSNRVFEFNGLKSSGVCPEIKPIIGDILLPGLGISWEDRQTLIRTVNIVMHLTANVKLNAPLRYVLERNIKPSVWSRL